MSEQTFGQKAVGLSFNPSQDDKVGQIKAKAAELIDLLNDDRDAACDVEVKRMLSIAITDLQSAQMWAVKAVTWR